MSEAAVSCAEQLHTCAAMACMQSAQGEVKSAAYASANAFFTSIVSHNRYVQGVTSTSVGISVKEKRLQEQAEKAKRVRDAAADRAQQQTGHNSKL